MKSVLVIGLGRFGKHIALKMQELGNDVMVVDQDVDLIDKYSSLFTDANIGDCTEDTVVKALGVSNFDLCFVAIGEHFQSCLEITSLLKEFGAKHVISKAHDERQAKLLKKIGADEVIFPEREVAEKLAIRYNSDNIFDFIELTAEYSIFEVPIPQNWVGRTIAEIDIRKKFSLNIIAVKNVEDGLSPMPGPEYKFAADDHAVVIGTAKGVFKLSSVK